MFDWLSDYIEPIKEIKVILESGEIQEIKSTNIHYVKQNSDRNYKEVFCNLGLIKWKTRISLSEIRCLLGKKLFIQLSRQEIVRVLSISGRDFNWEYLSICVYSDRNYRIKELKIGRGYLSEVQKYFERLPSLKIKNSYGDVFLINPLNVAYIVVKRTIKQLYLNKPVYVCNKKKYVLEWHSRLSAAKIIEYTKTNSFVQVNRNTLVNLEFIKKTDLPNMIIALNYKGQEIEKNIGDKYRASFEG